MRERDFTVINPEFRGTVIEALLERLPFAFGRTRIMRMPKKSCLSIHWDTSLRYLYEMDARLTHTAINASRHARIQLVICDARDENLKDGRPAEHAELLPSR